MYIDFNVESVFSNDTQVWFPCVCRLIECGSSDLIRLISEDLDTLEQGKSASMG